jgi:hypothetical protein
MQSGRQRLDQQRLLIGEDRAKVKDEAVLFYARDHGNAGGGAAESLFQLGRGISRAGDSNHFGRQ